MFEEYFTEKMRELIKGTCLKIADSQCHSFSDPEETLVSKLIKDHPSFISHWENYGFDNFAWDEKDINPFTHILMHYIVEKLLKEESETAAHIKMFYRIRKRKFMRHHDITHMLAQIIAENIFSERRNQGKFNIRVLHSDLKKYSVWNKKKFWDHFIPEEEEEEEQ